MHKRFHLPSQAGKALISRSWICYTLHHTHMGSAAAVPFQSLGEALRWDVDPVEAKGDTAGQDDPRQRLGGAHVLRVDD